MVRGGSVLRIQLSILNVSICVLALGASAAEPSPPLPQLVQMVANGASAILENKGQVADSVKYYVPGSRSGLFFTPEEIVFKLGPPAKAALPNSDDDDRHAGQMGVGLVVRMKFEGAKTDPTLAPKDPQQGAINVIRREGTAATTSELKRYSAITYENLYPGIDLECRVGKDGLSRTLVVHGDAKPNKVKIAYDGVDGVRMSDDGQLELITDIGVVRESPLVIRRAEKKDGDTDLVARFVVIDRKTIGIETGPAK